MSRPKKPFADILADWAEEADPQEFRDSIVMLSVYARQRKLDFKIRVETVKPAQNEAPLFKGEF